MSTDEKVLLTQHRRHRVNWDDWFGGDDDPTQRKSYSSFWRDRWARDDDDPIAPDGSERPATYMRHLQALRNVCVLAFGKGRLTVDWATEDISATDINAGHIVLSPRPFKDRSPQYSEWTIGERLDVLFGRALHEGAHNAYTPANSKALAHKFGGQMMAELFNLMEDAYIETEIMEIFPGFAGYFDRKADFDFTPEEIQMRVSKLLATDLTYIEKPKTEDELKNVVEQVTNFVNVMIPACKSRNPVDTKPLYDAGGRAAQIAEGIDKIVRQFRGCETANLDLDERMDAARYAYRVICNLFSEPVGDENGNGGTPVSFVLNGKADGAIQQMFRNGGVGASSGSTPAGEGTVHGVATTVQNKMNTVGTDVAQIMNAMMNANMRDEEIETFHAGAHGVLKTTARIVDMRRKVYGDQRYREIREKVKRHEQRLKLALQFRSADKTYTERERPYGKIDPSRLYQIGAFNSRDVFMRKITTTAPSAHVAVLCDESGSMNEKVNGGDLRKDETAAASAIMLERALVGNKAISYEFWGHTGDMYYGQAHDPRNMMEERRGPVAGTDWGGPFLMRYLDSRAGLTDPQVLGRICARSQNYDGYALDVVYNSIINNAPNAQRRVLIIICDGMPSGHGYAGSDGVNHTADVVRKARKNNVEVIAIFVGRLDHAKQQMVKMYGRENHDWIHVPQPDDLPSAVEKIARRILHWDGGAA